MYSNFITNVLSISMVIDIPGKQVAVKHQPEQYNKNNKETYYL